MRAGNTHHSTDQRKRHFDSSKLWETVASNNFYRNPIICSDYSDPDVIRHGEDYYLTSSSFNCTPGLPILHSRDLVHWEIINHAVRNLPAKRFEQVQHGCGIWAPSIRYHDGLFWIFFPMPDEGIYVTTAEDPAGRWSAPTLIKEGRGLIDPCPLWDDDGSAYLVHAYAHSRSGIRHRLRVCPMSPDGKRLLAEAQIVYEEPEKHPTIEGPKFLKKDGWYYILAPAGGVSTGWQVVLRSRSIYGPYEDRIILEQGSTPVNGPHQGALVDTPEGEWWFVHFQDAGPYGRITHLQPANWQDGWPQIGVDEDGNGVGEPVLQYPMPRIATQGTPRIIQATDEFDDERLGLQWQWNANHSEEWYSLTARPGALRLFAQPAPSGSLMDVPNVLAQKFPKRTFSVETIVQLPENDNGVQTGLVVLGSSYAGLVVSRQQSLLKVKQLCCEHIETDAQEKINEEMSSSTERIWLRLEVSENAECSFSASVDGNVFVTLGKRFNATAGKWIGARVGLVCLGHNSHADFEYFRVE